MITSKGCFSFAQGQPRVSQHNPHVGATDRHCPEEPRTDAEPDELRVDFVDAPVFALAPGAGERADAEPDERNAGKTPARLRPRRAQGFIQRPAFVIIGEPLGPARHGDPVVADQAFGPMDGRAVPEDPGAAVLGVDDLVHPIEGSRIDGAGGTGLVNAHEDKEDRGQGNYPDRTRGLPLDQEDQHNEGGGEEKPRRDTGAAEQEARRKRRRAEGEDRQRFFRPDRARRLEQSGSRQKR